MISRADIDERVRRWEFREDVVEKDYVFGWVLWGIGTEPWFHDTWVFNGATCLKKLLRTSVATVEPFLRP